MRRGLCWGDGRKPRNPPTAPDNPHPAAATRWPCMWHTDRQGPRVFPRSNDKEKENPVDAIATTSNRLPNVSGQLSLELRCGCKSLPMRTKRKPSRPTTQCSLSPHCPKLPR